MTTKPLIITSKRSHCPSFHNKPTDRYNAQVVVTILLRYSTNSYWRDVVWQARREQVVQEHCDHHRFLPAAWRKRIASELQTKLAGVGTVEIRPVCNVAVCKLASSYPHVYWFFCWVRPMKMVWTYTSLQGNWFRGLIWSLAFVDNTHTNVNRSVACAPCQWCNAGLGRHWHHQHSLLIAAQKCKKRDWLHTAVHVSPIFILQHDALENVFWEKKHL